ncbi:alpha/beta hydrolase [Parabacteroides sp. Marseille-P3160]|uniref:alpha/beta hydrolase n=1 Tax=Parabacteroides sp. Marseille-P3160 TaxID=1917887 RepID=UPI0009BC14E9|nr:alpha/beta hydrolase [Parabacteroides sp. Marseille-P3160]
MASIQSKIFQILLRLVNMKGSWEKEMRSGKIDTKSYRPEPPKWLFQKVNIKTGQINRWNVYTLSPLQNAAETVVLFLHGGGYIHAAALQHWQFVYRLIKHSGCTVVFPDYPLAPKYTYKDAFEVVEPLYKKLLARHGAKNLIVMGDSAGGGFSLALSQKMKNEDIEPPIQTILLSPWLDISTSNPEMKTIDPKDAFLGIKGLQMAGKAYAGDLDMQNYLVSPINGPLKGLGKISIFTGTHDIFVCDARKFKSMCQSEGVDINYYEYEGMPHVWMILGFPESRRAIDEIVRLINRI